MPQSELFLNPLEAASQLGVSAKALRLYEQRGLLVPTRSAKNWRAYGPADMARAAEIIALRQIGLSLTQIGNVLKGASQGLEPVLANHQAVLERQHLQLASAIQQVHDLRAELAHGRRPDSAALRQALCPSSTPPIAFALPHPWAGESFALMPRRPLTYLTGPLGSGKTQLALAITRNLAGSHFIGLERQPMASSLIEPEVLARIADTLTWLAEDGATIMPQLETLVTLLETPGPTALVIDLVEQHLDHLTQQALITRLRQRPADARPLFLMTRSTAILDLAAIGAHEAIIFCPANHSPPRYVVPIPGAAGYEALASCLASPAVRARTEGIVAWRPETAKGAA